MFSLNVLANDSLSVKLIFELKVFFIWSLSVFFIFHRLLRTVIPLRGKTGFLISNHFSSFLVTKTSLHI